jgi:hypothetical protein
VERTREDTSHRDTAFPQRQHTGKENRPPRVPDVPPWRRRLSAAPLLAGRKVRRASRRTLRVFARRATLAPFTGEGLCSVDTTDLKAS